MEGWRIRGWDLRATLIPWSFLQIKKLFVSNYRCKLCIKISFSILIFHRCFFFFNCTWISKQYSVLSEHKLSCIHEKVCNTLSLSAYTCSTADGSLILIRPISITQMICFFWPKIWKWILPIQWLSFFITFFLRFYMLR